VHSVGGWAALVGATVLGPRMGKYDKNGNARPIPGHNLALVTLGGLILWLGWFGFNGGTELAIDEAVPHIIITTALSASFGTVAATIWSWIRTSKPDLTLIINGMLGGLVGITAGCNVVPLWASAVIGVLCGVLVIESVMFFDRIKIDDPVGAISVHLVCGVTGTLLTGVFMADKGLIASGSFHQLGVQLQGVLAIGGLVVVLSLATWLLLKATLGIRVTPEDEMLGLDISEHGMEAYPAANERSEVYTTTHEGEEPAPAGVLAPSRS
jgi:Amt family ammonium transporter